MTDVPGSFSRGPPVCGVDRFLPETLPKPFAGGTPTNRSVQPHLISKRDAKTPERHSRTRVAVFFTDFVTRAIRPGLMACHPVAQQCPGSGQRTADGWLTRPVGTRANKRRTPVPRECGTGVRRVVSARRTDRVGSIDPRSGSDRRWSDVVHPRHHPSNRCRRTPAPDGPCDRG